MISKHHRNYSFQHLRRTRRALDALSFASFFDIPDPSADMSLREALKIKFGAWDGPEVDSSWYMTPGAPETPG